MRVYRLLSIIMLLLNRDKASAVELAAYFEVSPRTIYRDIEAICQAGIPIVSYQGINGGFSIMENYKMDKNLFTPEEIISILAALEGLNSTFDDRKIKDITEKMKALLPTNPKSDYQTNEELIIDLNPWSNNKSLKERINLIRKAINSKNIIKFNYINLKQEQLTRKAEPMSLILKGSSWYLYAFCLLRDDFRIFKLTRMRELNLLEDFFKTRTKNFSIFEEENNWNKSDNIVHLVLKFKTSSLLAVQDYFAEEEIEFKEDGSIIVEVDYPEDEWLPNFLLGFGDNVEVINPERYRKLLKEKANSIIKQYS